MDKFDIHKWQRDALSSINELNDNQIDKVINVREAIFNLANSLEGDEYDELVKYIRERFCSSEAEVTSEEVNTHSKIEKELKGIFADKLGVDVQDIEFTNEGTNETVQETALGKGCHELVDALGGLVRLVPQLATKDSLQNFLSAIVDSRTNGKRLHDIYPTVDSVSRIKEKKGIFKVIWDLPWKLLSIAIDAVRAAAHAGCWAGDLPFQVAVLVINKYGPGTEGYPED